MNNARSGGGVCEGPVDGFGVVADYIRPMQISHNTVEEKLTIVEGSIHTWGVNLEMVGYNPNAIGESLYMVGNSRD